MMRCVVTGVKGGRSRVVRDGEAGETWPGLIWDTTEEEPLGSPDVRRADGGLPDIRRGESAWMVVALPPDAEMEKMLAEGIPGLDSEGFHKTETIDYIVVLDDGVTLVLDEGEVPLVKGDLVVQRATRHAWRNSGPGAARLLCLMSGV